MSNLTGDSKVHIEYEKKVLAAVLQVHPYVAHRLYTAETTGIVPRNMYKSSGIIDDAIVRLYEINEDEIENKSKLKLKLFSLVSEILDELFDKEEFHKYTLSTSQILSKELEQLEEKFEIDLDNDLLMSDELDDISYHQDDDKKPSMLYDDAEKNIITALEVLDLRSGLSEEKRKALNKIYNWLPIETSNILDLFVFGKLSYKEIGKIKNLDTYEVKNTIRLVSKNLRKNLN